MVSSHPVVSDKEWVQARIAFMDLEREHKAATRVLAEKRRLLPWRKIKDDYIFDGGPLGKRSLVELFGKADTLFVYHLMYATGDERACPRCTSLLDQFQSMKLHIQASGLMTFVIIAKGEYTSLMNAVGHNNWIWDIYSAAENQFAEDLGVSKGGGLSSVEGKYDYVNDWPGGVDGPANLPGISIFKKDDAGNVYHTYSVYGTYLLEFVQYNFMFDLTPDGRPLGSPEMSFLKHKDKYPYPKGEY
jgi:predicted dithiol-disulfide oxidoreductase (DUF899 family)